MTWYERYPKAQAPALEQIAEHIGSPLWGELRGFVETTYGFEPRIAYSTCSGAPGWNIKYGKGGRALCTLYPHEGFFTCLICIGGREAMEAELVLTACSAYTRELYQRAKPYNGTRWLMLDVTSRDVLEDVERLFFVRIKPKNSRGGGKAAD